MNRVRELRERAGLTQGELAILAGTTEGTISRVERGARPFTPALITALSRIFKVQSWEVLVDRRGLRLLGEGATDHRSEPQAVTLRGAVQR